MDNENGRYVMTPTSTGGQLIYKRTHFTWHRHIPSMKSRLPLIYVQVWEHGRSFVRMADRSAMCFRWNFSFASIENRVSRSAFRYCSPWCSIIAGRKVSFTLPYSFPFNNRNGNRCRDYVVKVLPQFSMRFTTHVSHRVRVNIIASPLALVLD